MPGQVRVEDFEVFRLFRGALLKFAQAAEQSLSSADAHIASVHSWLESEQMTLLADAAAQADRGGHAGP